MTEDLPIACGTAMPIGWTLVNFEDICGSGQYGWTSSASSEGTVKYLRTTDITKGKISWDSVPYCKETPADIEKYRVQKNDILISRAGSIGFSSLIDEIPTLTIFASYLIRFVPSEEVKPTYIAYFLKSPDYWRQIADFSSGIALANINAKKISKIKVPLPPLNEQRRIVEKLDRIFDRLRKVRDELSHIKKLIDRYRQAVLTAAFRGDLTADWRENPMPSNWNFKKFRLVADFKNGINFSKEKKGDKGIPTVDVLNMYSKGIYVDVRGLYNVDIDIKDDYILKYGDILFVRSSVKKEGVGWTSLFPKTDKTVTFCGFIIRARVNLCEVYPEFLTYFFRTDNSRRILIDSSHQVTIANINQVSLSELDLLLPPLEEQKEIVRRVEERFAKIEKIEQEYQKAVKLCDRLEQETLAKAFRGELVPQDPNDEPASVLLERIRAEQQSKTQAKTAKSKKRSGKK